MSDIDLRELQIAAPTAPTARRGHRSSRWFGAVLAAIAAGVALSFVWPWLRPVRAVATAPVRAVARDVRVATAVAEAAGWVEPDPFAIEVRPLVAGVVATFEVIEGDAVTAGETVIATLASASLEAAAARAAALVAERDSELALARERVAAAAARLEQNAAARQAALAQRERVAAAETRRAALLGRQRTAEADAAASDAAERAQVALHQRGGSNAIALERAAAAARAARATVAALVAEGAGADAELAAARTALELAAALADDPVDLSRGLRVAEREAGHAAARHAVAVEELAIARRELDWATVRAPVDGVVLRVGSRPGGHAGPAADPLAAIYDPRRLRARIDVPLDAVGAIRAGDPVEVRSEALGDAVVAGSVQRVLHEADLLKNTLRVHVGLVDPPPGLRPEMLCRARFLGGAAGPAAGDGAPRDATFRIPGRAIRDGAVHVLDPDTGTARRIAVDTVATEGDDALVQGELSVTQRVILDAVSAGDRVRDAEDRR